jgi:UDP-N-acetylglucosamine:LPS N-acetylglucosamine transferase
MSKKILAIASGGGHWIQLTRLCAAFEGIETIFVGVDEIYRAEVTQNKFYSIMNVSRLCKWGIIFTIFKLFFIIYKEKPDVIVTTGSAPGMLALRIGKFLGTSTIWIDSIANVEEMSMSGVKARKYADLWLTQWPHLERPGGPKYFGSVL